MMLEPFRLAQHLVFHPNFLPLRCLLLTEYFVKKFIAVFHIWGTHWTKSKTDYAVYDSKVIEESGSITVDDSDKV